jgi:hypothetical protein
MIEYVDSMGYDENQRLRAKLINSANSDSETVFKLGKRLYKLRGRRRVIIWSILYAWILIANFINPLGFMIMFTLCSFYLINYINIMKVKDEHDIMTMVLRFTKHCEKQIRFGEI